MGSHRGVWRLHEGRAAFKPVTVGTQTLDGLVQIVSGLGAGETVIVHSSRPLEEGMRVTVEESLVRVAP